MVTLPALERTLTAVEVWRAALDNVRVMTAMGLGRGDLVVCAIGNRPELVPVVIACRMLDVALMAVDTGSTEAEIDSLCGRFGAAASWHPLARAAPLRPGALGPAVALTRCTGAQWSYPCVAVLKAPSESSGPPRAARTTEAQLVADGRTSYRDGIGPAGRRSR